MRTARSITTVGHCWKYSRCLTYHLSSLLLWPPTRVDVTAVVFCSPEDTATQNVLRFFLAQEWPPNVYLNACCVDRRYLLNRSVCRNAILRDHTINGHHADLFWFTDIDYLFRGGCLDSLADLDLDSAPMFYPRQTWFTKDRETGDEYAARAADPEVLDIDTQDFVPHKPGKAIGGIQIVPGDVARKIGYCPDIPKDQKPVADDCYSFKRNFSDTRFRKQIGQKIIGDGKRYRGLPVDIPGVYRIRQTQFGQVDSIPDRPVECRQP